MKVYVVIRDETVMGVTTDEQMAKAVARKMTAEDKKISPCWKRTSYKVWDTDQFGFDIKAPKIRYVVDYYERANDWDVNLQKFDDGSLGCTNKCVCHTVPNGSNNWIMYVNATSSEEAIQIAKKMKLMAPRAKRKK